MTARGVRVGRATQAKLHVDRRRDADDLRDLVEADETAEVVRTLDVDIERDVDGEADRGDLREREVRRQVDGVRAQVGDDPRCGGVRDGQHDRDLRLHVGRQLTRGAHRREYRQRAQILDEHAADPMRRGAAGVLENGDELFRPARGRRNQRTDRRARHRGRVPSRVGPGEEADLDACGRPETRHLVELLVRVHENSASL